MRLIQNESESKLINYALEYVGKKELDWYCRDIESNYIDLGALKDHLIGKVGLDDKKVNNLFREDFLNEKIRANI